MQSSSRGHVLPDSWRFALVGALASLPITAVLNRLPNSEATVGGGIMIFGAFIAGVVAAIRSSDPSAAGLRAGFTGAVLGVLIFLLTAGTTVAWPLPRVVFWIFAGGLVVCVASLFGIGFGRAGGWMANTVASRWSADADAPHR
ncbi:DUF5518 domain-containing protein [Natronoarchaeum rubrum]|uniref:DUF5518 domain-containing protein n=1 Tax=Natronoarchaeum rubrum TaxID=755311 RepID=UPI0021132A94|nr:DUF5518 domain-containing protein [Natronoarchaeum rubrum]